MSFLSGLSGTPHLGDKGVENYWFSRFSSVEITALRPSSWVTALSMLTLSTVIPEPQGPFHLGKGVVIHNSMLAITTNIYK